MSGYTTAPRAYNDGRIEAIITCWNYSDFLAETLPWNLPHVDRLVVVTDHNDEGTQAVCAKWSVECVTTDAFSEKGEAFNKGSGINIGLQAIRQQGWIMQMDADVVLPVQFRNMLDKVGLQRDYIYGAERVNVVTFERWHQLKTQLREEPQFTYRYLVTTDPDLPIGANLVHKHYGWCPIGYLQLWHSKYMHENNLRYPDTEGSAENMDVQWALRWPRRQRSLMPTVRVFHLESEASPMGANWSGRKTKPFTADGQAPITPCVSGQGYGYGYRH